MAATTRYKDEMKTKFLALFGGALPWDPSLWTSSDDRVRGGSSKSSLSIYKPKAPTAAGRPYPPVRFHGHLDTSTLGGAGFASQRTTTTTTTWDLSSYAGLELVLLPGASDDKRYTLNIKDALLPPNPADGRERATISWEYDFTASAEESGGADVGDEEKTKVLCVPWVDFKPTYRGREAKDADPLDTKNIKRFSIMVRSFFDKQDGDFELVVQSIRAYGEGDDKRGHDGGNEKEALGGGDGESVLQSEGAERDGLVGSVLRCLGLRKEGGVRL